MELKELQIGQQVTVRRYGNIQSITIIIRTTQTLIVTLGNIRWNRRTGLILGEGSWASSSISPTTIEDKQYLRRRNNLRKISEFNFQCLSDDKLLKVINIIENWKE